MLALRYSDDMNGEQKDIGADLVAEPSSYANRFPELVGVQGWLLFFSMLITLSIAVNLYSGLDGLLHPVQYTNAVLTLHPSLIGFITFSNTMEIVLAFGGALVLVHILRRSKNTRKIAIIYAATLLIYAVLETLLGFMQYGNDSAVLNAAFKGGGQIRMFVYSSALLAYFLTARRVRATFEGMQHIDAGVTSENIRQVSSLSSHHGKFEKQLHRLEDLAVDLDRACRDGEVPVELLKTATKYVETVGGGIADSKAVAERAYIVYEVQALLYWIKHQEGEARELARTAVEIKGDDVLFTQTANMIVRD